MQAVLINKRFVPDPPNVLVAPAQMFCLLATATVTKLQYSTYGDDPPPMLLMLAFFTQANEPALASPAAL